MQMYNLAGCSSIYAGQGLPLTSEQMIADLKAKNARCCIVTYPAGSEGMEKALRGAGAFIIWNTHSAHNAGKGMNIWLIPGQKGTSLYEGKNNGNASSPADPERISEKQRLNVMQLNLPKNKKSPKKRINWKKRYQALRKRRRG